MSARRKRAVIRRRPREQVIDDACCPRCGRDVETVEPIQKGGYHDGLPTTLTPRIVGWRVRHAGHNVSCSMKEWPIFDPLMEPTDVNNSPGALPNSSSRGLTICQTCYSTVQHISHEWTDEPGGKYEISVEPVPRDDAGDPICGHCERRTN